MSSRWLRRGSLLLRSKELVPFYLGCLLQERLKESDHPSSCNRLVFRGPIKDEGCGSEREKPLGTFWSIFSLMAQGKRPTRPPWKNTLDRTRTGESGSEETGVPKREEMVTGSILNISASPLLSYLARRGVKVLVHELTWHAQSCPWSRGYVATIINSLYNHMYYLKILRSLLD